MDNLPMAFCWRGISSSSVAARTAFVDREPAPAVILLTYERPQAPAEPVPPVAAKPKRQPKRAAETLLFAVAEEQPTRGDLRRFKYTSAVDAERAARRIVTGRGGSMGIWLHHEKSFPVEVATVLRDSLDRVWTEVHAKPGQRAYL